MEATEKTTIETSVLDGIRLVLFILYHKFAFILSSQREETLFLCESNRHRGHLLMVPESASSTVTDSGR